MTGARLKIAPSKKAVAMLNQLIQKHDFELLMQNAKTDPKSEVGRFVWQKMKPCLELMGGNVMPGAFETSQNLTKMCEITKRHGCSNVEEMLVVH